MVSWYAILQVRHISIESDLIILIVQKQYLEIHALDPKIRQEFSAPANKKIRQEDYVRRRDFIRYSKDKNKLKELLETDASYANLDEDAYDVIAAFTKSEELMRLKEKNREGEKQDMCQALKDWAAEERREGKLESLRAIMENLGFSLERAMDVLNIPMEDRAQYIANI